MHDNQNIILEAIEMTLTTDWEISELEFSHHIPELAYLLANQNLDPTELNYII